MAKIKYYYDTNTCKYERVVTKPGDVFVNILGFAVLSLLSALFLLGLYFKFFNSPKEAMLVEENKKLRTYYDIVNTQLGDASKMLKSLKDRDNQIYRIIFETSPDQTAIKSTAEISNLEAFKTLVHSGLGREGLILKTIDKIVEFKEQLYSQEDSYDEILALAKRKEEMLASIPAIQPISNKQLKQLASGYGMRIHPIYKVKKFHAGIDFSAPRGTPIYATGDGIIHLPGTNSGYGNCIEINHGYGYMTRYGHLDKIKVQNGEQVKRGEIIGYVGSTGTATSPHLHYEVHKNDKTVDPINFFFNDLTPKEYEELIKLSSVENQSLG
jgi:murein DD-endopeptidase MepM/ murein hydrolase activator NlpD